MALADPSVSTSFRRTVDVRKTCQGKKPGHDDTNIYISSSSKGEMEKKRGSLGSTLSLVYPDTQEHKTQNSVYRQAHPREAN